MYFVAILFAFLVGLTKFAEPQCITDVDNLDFEGDLDLSSISNFGFELFREVFPYESERNFFFSPYSIWSTLTLAYFGSGGQTETQLSKVLRVQDKVSTLKKWRGVEFLYNMRQANSSDYIFQIANRAYFGVDVKLRECMENILHSEIQNLNFSQPEKAAVKINTWVAETTKNRIKQLVSPSDIINANMVLANAAFFKGTWLYQFKPLDTKKDIFYTSRTEYSFVDMMTQKGNFLHGISEELGAHVLELPYTGDSISMIVVLPPFISGEQGFSEMVKKINGKTLSKALDDMWRLQVEVTMPKFKLEETVGDELIEALVRLGITDLFNPLTANLTGFSASESLSVGKSIHKAFVEVNEEGTEAAAATALISFRVARPVGPQVFRCDHPFLFLIFDKDTKNILFMGAYKSPKQ